MKNFYLGILSALFFVLGIFFLAVPYVTFAVYNPNGNTQWSDFYCDDQFDNGTLVQEYRCYDGSSYALQAMSFSPLVVTSPMLQGTLSFNGASGVSYEDVTVTDPQGTVCALTALSLIGQYNNIFTEVPFSNTSVLAGTSTNTSVYYDTCDFTKAGLWNISTENPPHQNVIVDHEPSVSGGSGGPIAVNFPYTFNDWLLISIVMIFCLLFLPLGVLFSFFKVKRVNTENPYDY